MTSAAPILQLTGIGKQFPGVTALDDVDLRVLPGEVHALMGENGAGKSTLIKVLTGVHPADSGTILLDGREVTFAHPLEAQHAGISTVYQEVNLCPNLSVAENILLGREPRKFGRIQWKAMRRRAAERLAALELDLDVTAPLSQYSLAIQQMVAIARALEVQARVLVLDEPTSSLDTDEVAQLFRVMRNLKEQGVAILFVSHFLDQVYEIADRMTILRNGRREGDYPIGELGQVELIAKMIGRDLAELERLDERPPARTTGTLLEADQLGRTGGIEPFALTIREGEVVGLAGLLGSGRTEVARLLFGADHATSGSVTIDGEPVSLRTPQIAMTHKIAFCPEDRKADGLIPDLTVRENVVLALQARRGWTRPIPREQQAQLVDRYIKALKISPPDPEQLVRNLSGGNQQKVLLARWLILEPRLLILDEPTRGIDVGAKAEIQRLVAELSDGGMAVLFISAELEEVLRLSHKVGVLRDRKLIAELPNDDTLPTEVLMQTIASGGRS